MSIIVIKARSGWSLSSCIENSMRNKNSFLLAIIAERLGMEAGAMPQGTPVEEFPAALPDVVPKAISQRPMEFRMVGGVFHGRRSFVELARLTEVSLTNVPLTKVL